MERPRERLLELREPHRPVNRRSVEDLCAEARARIVDDEPTMCELIQEVLVASGMEVLTVTRSTEATGYLRDQKFDVVLLDLCTPAPDGIALARNAWFGFQPDGPDYHDQR